MVAARRDGASVEASARWSRSLHLHTASSKAPPLRLGPGWHHAGQRSRRYRPRRRLHLRRAPVRVHETWARCMGTQLREVESGFRYTPTSTFDTFPFPHPSEAQREAIAEAARDLDRLRNSWLNPPGLADADLVK